MGTQGTKIWQWAAILLLLCNLALAATIWLHPRMAKEHRGEGPRNMVIKELGMTQDQVQQYDALIKDHRAAMNRLRDQGQGYRKALFTTLGEHAANERPDSLVQLIAANQKEVEQVTYEHFRKVRALCTPEQQKTFDRIIGDVTARMNGPQGPPPHGPGAPPPPPDDRQGPPPPPEGR